MHADVATLLSSIVLVSLTLALTIGFASYGRDARSLQRWSLVMLLHGAAYLLLSQRGNLPDFISIVIGNILLSATFAQTLYTVARFRQQPLPAWICAAPVALTAILYYLFIDNQTARTLLSGIIFGSQQLLIVVATLRPSPNPVGRGHLLLAGAVSLTGVMVMARAVAVATGATQIPSLVSQSPLQALTFTLALIVPLLGTVGFVFMVKQNADRQASTSQARLDTIFDSIEESIALLDRQGTILAINRIGAQRLGQSPEHLIGHPLAELTPAVADHRLEVIRRVLDSGKAEQFEDQRDSYRFRLNLYPVRGSADTVVMHGTDITQAHAAEEALRRSEAHFRAFFERSMVGMAATSPTKGWVEVNPALCAILGYPAAELMRMTWTELTHPDDLAADVTEFDRLVTGQREEYEMDKRFIRKDGHIIDARIAVRGVRLADGRIDYFVALVDDITERKQRERELASNLAHQRELNARLEDAHNQLLQAEKMASIGQLAAGVAHELNNPIGFVHSNLGTLESYLQDIILIIGQSQQIARATATPEQIAALDRLLQEKDFDFIKQDINQLLAESKEGLSRVRKIVQDLKDFSRVGETHWQWADLHQGLDSTLNIVWNELKYHCSVEKHYAADLPRIHCLPSQLNQVFMNLLLNAAQAMPADAATPGKIILRSRRHGSDAIQIEFGDNGQGIAEADLKRIFEPFYTTKPVGKGTGLGLSLAWGIIGKHKGRIDVASTRGQGTTFTLTLPIDPAGSAENLPS